MPLQPPGAATQPLRQHPNRGQKTLGPPDVYPQEPNQKEDELNVVHVKHGFAQTHASLVPEEYSSMFVSTNGSAASNPGSIISDLKAILDRKEETSVLPDSGSKKRQSINVRDHFWLVTAKNKPLVDCWFKDLASNR